MSNAVTPHPDRRSGPGPPMGSSRSGGIELGGACALFDLDQKSAEEGMRMVRTGHLHFALNID